MTLNLRTNDRCRTANGPGVVEGALTGECTIYDTGTRVVVVRHKLAEMSERSAGKCLTPKATVSGLWAYDESEVTRA